MASSLWILLVMIRGRRGLFVEGSKAALNKFKLLLTSILVGLSLLPGITEADSRWSGTIHMDQTHSGVTGKSERHVTVNFTNALPTYDRDHEGDPDTYTDDKGKGSHTYHGEAIIAGKKYSTTDCTGGSKGSLMKVYIDEQNKTFEIAAMSPECVGKTVSLIDGSVEDYGPDTVAVHVPAQKLTDPNVLAGIWSETIDSPGLGPVTTTVTWNLSRGKPLDIELIVTPANYDKWLPTPGKDELIKGSVLEVALKLQAIGGGPPAQKAESFDVHLVKTSREPGFALNAPLNPSATQLPDLRLLPHPSAESVQEDQFLNVKSPDGLTGKTYIASYDGGGYSILSVEAILTNPNRRIKGHLSTSPNDTDIPIPKRPATSNIGTAWLIANGNPQDRDDKEKSPGNSNDGDGFSAYEEYRGFLSEGKFKRFDPEEKELAVKVLDEELPLFKEGIDLFEAASGLRVVRFGMGEVPQSRRINLNFHTSNVYKQFAVPLTKGSLNYLGAGALANTFCTTPGNIDIPAKTKVIVIDLNAISQLYHSLQQKLHNPTPVPYTMQEYIATTVAHELAHAVDVPHHGDLENQPPQKIVDNTYRIYDIFQKEITLRPYIVEGNIGLPGSGGSGDMSCIMAYNPYFAWALTTDSSGTKIYSQVPFMPLGKSMCKSRVGTGINAPSTDPRVPNRYFGKAVNGNCLSLIKLWE